MAANNKQFKSLEDFTNLYKVQKTLRFELKPIGKTGEFLEKNEVFKKDEKIAESYQNIKPIFDELHRTFVAESLAVNRIDVLSLQGFAQEYAKYRVDPKKNKKVLEDAEKKLWKILANNFDILGEIWKERYNGKTYLNFEGKEKVITLKKNGYEVLLDNDVMGILAIEYSEQSELFGLFDGFFTYFSGFNETRENFYKHDGTATAVVTRIVDNFEKFLENNEISKRHLELREDLKLTEDESGIFKVDSYASCLLQKDIEQYNLAIGELNKRMKMLRDEQGKDVKKSEYPFLKTIYDQILGDRKKQIPFVVIESNKDARSELDALLVLAHERFAIIIGLVKRFCSGGFESDAGTIYLTNKAINTISRRWMSDGLVFEGLLPQLGKKTKEDDAPKIARFVSFADIQLALNKMEGDIYKEQYKGVIGAPHDHYQQFLAILENEFNSVFTGETREEGEDVHGWLSYENELKQVLEVESNIRSEKCKKAIKKYLDAGLRIFQLAKYFSLDIEKKKGAERPTQESAEFYNEYNRYNADFSFAKKYDVFRNYLSHKIGDEKNKVKLNFENGTLLSGWDKNKEKENLGILLRSGGSMYLGLLVDGHKNIFDDGMAKYGDESHYEKMEYKFFPDPKRMIPKVSFADCNARKFGLTDEIIEIRNNYKVFQEDKKMDKENWKKQFDKNKLSKLITYYQHCLSVGGYQKEYGFTWKNPEEYTGLGDFNDEIESQNYKVTFKPISKEYINERVDTGELYLFEIHNKDNNLKDGKEKTGTKNIHTMYWNSLFTEENLRNPLCKLSGGAELFLRRGKPGELKPKKDLQGKTVLEHKRYERDKLFFHVPIVINRGGENTKQYKHNQFVREYLAQSENTCVIGIDRGEKHLLYYSVLNQKGKILDQGSLNTIQDVDYYQKLVNCEKQKIIDQQSWEPARKIKDLKSGYISQAVHLICGLIKKHNAIVVLEDLNMRFKQIRGGVERSVYQQFEHALINKLGYLVFKDKQSNENGGVYHGYQLTAPFESFEKLGKQTGFLFYTQADYTSITDPLTGFRKNVYISNSTPNDKLKALFSNQIAFSWDNEKGSYCFEYDQKDFGDKKSDITSKKWKVFANVPRIKRFKENGYWQSRLVNPNEIFEELFNIWGIQNPHGDISEMIQAADNHGYLNGKKIFDGKECEFWKSFVYIFNLILQLRNSASQQYLKNENSEIVVAGEEIDFISSPVEPFFMTGFTIDGKNHKANFAGFDKRIIGGQRDRIMQEFNGDANGAYNIARKGIIIIEAIKENKEKPELFISKVKWDKFTQQDTH